MADRFDAIQRLELLLDGRLAPFGRAAERAVDELDGLEDAAGGLGLPDFAETARAEALDELVARNRLRLRVGSSGHQHGPDAGGPKETSCASPGWESTAASFPVPDGSLPQRSRGLPGSRQPNKPIRQASKSAPTQS